MAFAHPHTKSKIKSFFNELDNQEPAARSNWMHTALVNLPYSFTDNDDAHSVLEVDIVTTQAPTNMLDTHSDRTTRSVQNSKCRYLSVHMSYL